LGKISDLTNGAELHFNRMPDIMFHILNEGGLIPYIKKHKDFVVNPMEK